MSREQSQPSKGDVVVILNDRSKHKARQTHIVTKVDPENVTISKVLHTSQFDTSLPRWSPVSHIINKKFVRISIKALQSQDDETAHYERLLVNERPSFWIPEQVAESESDWSDTESCGNIRTCEPVISPVHADPAGDQLINPQVSSSDTDTTNPCVLIQNRVLKKNDRVTYIWTEQIL